MDTTKTIETLSNEKIETLTITYLGGGVEVVPDVMGKLKAFAPALGDDMKQIADDLKRLLALQAATIVDRHYTYDDIIYRVHLTRVSLKATRSTPLLSRTEFADFIGRGMHSASNSMRRLRDAGLPVPTAGQPIPLDIAREIKARMERDGSGFIRVWQTDVQKCKTL